VGSFSPRFCMYGEVFWEGIGWYKKKIYGVRLLLLPYRSIVSTVLNHGGVIEIPPWQNA
jgi:hypothetical protein